MKENGVNALGEMPAAESASAVPEDHVANIFPPAAMTMYNSFNGSMESEMVAMPILDQDGELFVGPGAKKEAQILGVGLGKLRSAQKDTLGTAKKYAQDLSVKQIMERQMQQQQQNQIKHQRYSQALSLMSRVYIGGLPPEVTESQLRGCFECYGSLKSLSMNYDISGNRKDFAFLEYDVPEAALLCTTSTTGLILGGRIVRVGRPANMPQAQPIIDMIMTESLKYHRVYVSSVHKDLTEADLKSVFEAFGEVRKCQLARRSAGRSGQHRGFGYIEFNSGRAVHEAITAMNMFDLGGQFLRVGKCITPPEALNYLTPQSNSTLPSAAAIAAAAITAKIQASEMIAKAKGENSPSPTPQINKKNAIARARKARKAVQASTQGQPGQIGEGHFNTPPSLNEGGEEDLLEEEAPVAPADTLDDFYSVLADPTPLKIAPPAIGIMPVAPPPPPPSLVAAPSTSRRRGFGGFATEAPPPGVVSLPGPSVAQPTLYEPSKPKKPKKSDMSVIDRIKVQQFDASAPATFGQLEDSYKPEEEKEKEEELALMGSATGDVAAMALAMLDGNNAMVLAHKRKEEKRREEKRKEEEKGNRDRRPRRDKPKAHKGPQLNTENALNAAARAGEMSDAIVNAAMGSDDATLASQEAFQIKGNDARHLLMTKLMRTNRSCVLLLKNMVTPDEIDEFLEEEIKEECGKYGLVEEVVIASDPSAGEAKVFVRFSDPQETDEAKKALDKRFFAGKSIQASIYDQALFDHNDLTG